MSSERRKKVMGRSMKLGHCVCDPKKPCPCELFKEKDVCLCAGEKLDVPDEEVKLTRLIEKPGCASKIDQAFLKRTLGSLPAFEHPNVIAGVPAGDDAGIYDTGDGKVLVQTVDVFTPCVDDAYTFGQVAAANSLSDIYAMGAQPITALSIVGFGVNKAPERILSRILSGGVDKMAEAGVPVIGGHSINESEIKAGFAVTGVAEKQNIITNDNAQPDDVLVLTKPLGTGIVAFAGQIGKARRKSLQAACDSMTLLNKTACELMLKYKANAATDVTGFSLMGHLSEMAFRSGVDVEIIIDNLPLLPGVKEYVSEGILPGAIERNKESCSDKVIPQDNICEHFVDMCYDAQTSGGLLVSIPSAGADDFVKDLHHNGIGQAAVIGKIKSKGSGKVFISSDGSDNFCD